MKETKFGKILDKLTSGAPFGILSENSQEGSIEEFKTAIGVVFRNLKLIALTVILLLVYISNRMLCEKQYSEIDKLNKELRDLKYVSMLTEAELLELSRPEKIKKLVEDNGLQLQELDCPPYKLLFDEE